MSNLPEDGHFPPPVKVPCTECPWRREATPGHLGPESAKRWTEMAHGETAIACHMTIKRIDDEGHGNWNDRQIRQCRGAAIFRRNVGKTPRNPSLEVGPQDTENVFASNDEFIQHHTERVMRQISVEGSTELMVEKLEAVLADVREGNPGHLENLQGDRYSPNGEIEFLPADPSEDPEGDWSELSISYRDRQDG